LRRGSTTAGASRSDSPALSCLLIIPRALREQLIFELEEVTKSDDQSVWAQRIPPLANLLTTPDAQAIEIAFAVKLN
jgi:hypothetical protein